MPDQGRTFQMPPSKDELFLAGLDKAITFHRTNPNDPYSISNAVICALTEVREAYAESHGLPLLARKGPQ